MSDPTALPFQAPQGSTPPGDSIYEGTRPDPARAKDPGPSTTTGAGAPPARSETDELAEKVSGPDDREGMTQLWRATMDLGHWWFIAVGDEGLESPAAAVIQDQLMLLTFTNAERARHFAVENGMIGADDDLRAIALSPGEVVESAGTYHDAGISGLMFDPHLSGYFIPAQQLPVVWDAVRGDAQE